MTSTAYGPFVLSLARRIAALPRPKHKVIVVDCDNTLWRGACGEDGTAGVELTPGHLLLQEMLVRQHDAGMLLCLCSKNNAGDVRAVFRNHPEMPLRDEHFTRWRVNWNAKSSNLQSLSAELDLPLDSFILIDDSPIECAEVRAHCPAVLTLQTREQAANVEQFLDSLELKVEMSPMQSGNWACVAELIQRTNQFNLTTIRRSLSDVKALSHSSDIQGFVVDVRDRFGDYGLVGVLFLRREPSAIDVDTFVLSSRVGGRSVEHRIVNELGRIARRRGLPNIRLRYRQTLCNAVAWDFLEKYFRQFQELSKGNGECAAGSVFTIPAEYAESLGNESAAAIIANEEIEPITIAKVPESTCSTQWYIEGRL